MYPNHETGELIDLHQDPVAKKNHWPSARPRHPYRAVAIDLDVCDTCVGKKCSCFTVCSFNLVTFQFFTQVEIVENLLAV